MLIPGLRAISLNGGENVYIHDNKFVDASSIETDGFSFENSPSLETSERIFSNIFDILKMDYNFVYPDCSRILRERSRYFPITNYSLVKVQGEDLTAVKVQLWRQAGNTLPREGYLDRKLEPSGK